MFNVDYNIIMMMIKTTQLTKKWEAVSESLTAKYKI